MFSECKKTNKKNTETSVEMSRCQSGSHASVFLKTATLKSSTLNRNKVQCLTREHLQNATPVDVGGLKVGRDR